MADVHDGATGGETAETAVEKHSSSAPSPGVAVGRADRIPDPGFPPSAPRKAA